MIAQVIVTTGTTIKNALESSWVLKLLIGLLTYLEPLKSLYHLMLFVMAVNFFTGWYKTYKTNTKGFIKSFDAKKAKYTAEKIGLFTFYLLIAYSFEMNTLMSTSLYSTRLISAILVLSEIKSISENGDTILNKKLFTPIYKRISLLFKSKAQE